MRVSVLVVVLVAGVAIVRAHENGGAAVPGCPALRPGTNDAAADYADVFTWRGTTYGFGAQPITKARLGEQLTTVGCSIAELTASNGNLLAPGPWPDRTATFLPSGTPVFAIRSVRATCQIAVPVDGAVKVYTSMDPDTGTLVGGC